MNKPLAKEQIAEVLASHLVWLRGETTGKRADLREANLREANLREANLREANLQGAYLQGANLRRANLRWANLQGANLREANLQGADLREANLREANLQRADLRWADLRRANLRWANLQGADLPFRIVQVGPIGSRADYLTYRFDLAQISTGCFSGTIAEFAEAVERTHGDSQYGIEYRSAIEMLQRMITLAEPVKEGVPQ